MEISLVLTMTEEFPTLGYHSEAVNKFEDLLSTGFMGYKSDLIEEMDISFICV